MKKFPERSLTTDFLLYFGYPIGRLESRQKDQPVVSRSEHILPTSVESCNKTLHIEAGNDPMEPMDKIPLLPD
jgi:hypothetical protein